MVILEHQVGFYIDLVFADFDLWPLKQVTGKHAMFAKRKG